MRKKWLTVVPFPVVPFLVVPFVLVTAVAALAQNPLIGTWKENLAKSHLAAGTITFASAGGGAIRFTEPEGTYTFKTDGSPVTNPVGRTVQWTKPDAHTWKEEVKLDSTTVTDRWALSQGDTVLTVDSTGTRPDGTSFHNTSVFHRAGSGKGLIGTWRDVKESTDQPRVERFSENSDGSLSWDLPPLKATLRLKPDGNPATPSGPTVPKGLTIAMTKAGPRSFHFVEKLNGKVIYSGTLTVSPDGKVLTERGRSPGQPATTDVYDKVE